MLPSKTLFASVIAVAVAVPSKRLQQSNARAAPFGGTVHIWRTSDCSGAPEFQYYFAQREALESLPGVEKGVLIQHGGEAWRQLRNGPVTLYGGIAVLVVLTLLALVYKLRGQIKLHDKPTGRMIERFTRTERTAHWAVAFSFLALAVTGALMLFGKHVLLLSK